MSPSVRHSERGAILIMVAISLLVLTLFSALAIDYGILWTGRAQAQTAADAAAISGAISLTFDNTTTANVQERAQAVGLRNGVMGEAPDIQLSDIQLIPCPTTPGLPAGDTCVKADAYRTVARNNPLPTFFASLAGINQQNARATATARAVSGTTANCIKPWAVGDKWFENPSPPGWNQTSVYEPANGDYYDPPTPANNYQGTGFSAKQPNGDPDYYGYQMILKIANPGQGANQIPIDSAGWAMELCLNNDNASGGPCSTPTYNENVTGCTTDTVNISQWNAPPCVVGSPDPSIGCIGVKTGATGINTHSDVVDFLNSHDPDARWHDGGVGAATWQTGYITPGSGKSPDADIVPVAVFDVPEYLAQAANGNNGVVRIVKIVGFFLEGTCQEAKSGDFALESYAAPGCPGGGLDKQAVVGRLVNYEATGPIGPAVGGFGMKITLVR
jgi:Flp pilus assembly protein TadG